MEIFLQYILPAFCGIFIGILSGLLGIGGGTVMVPMFRLLFGMSPLMSTATSLFAIIPTSMAGAVAHIRAKTMYVPLGLALGIGGALTSPLGVWLSTISPSWLVMLTAALIIGYSAVNMLFKAFRMKPEKNENFNKPEIVASKRKAENAVISATSEEAAVVSTEGKVENEISSEDGEQIHQSQQTSEMKFDRKILLGGGAIGVLAGVLSGYVGVGGGFIMVPFMIAFLGVPMKMASGTSLLAVMILSISGVIEHALMGNINYIAGLIVAIGSIPGAVIGARLVRIIPERTLRFIFGGFLIVAAILLAINEL